MEFFVVIAVIVVLALVLGVKPIVLLAAGGALVWLIFAAVSILFIYFFVRLVTSERTKGYFTKIDKKDSNRFKTAFYSVDGTEYPNVFPEEGLMQNILYKKDREYRLRLNKKGYVFDRFSTATCFIGLILSTAFIAGNIYAAYILLR